MRAFLHYLSSPKLLFYLLPWFMLLLVLGTIAQRYIGLQESLRLFFTGWIFWLGVVPLPGGMTTLALLSLSLLLRLLLASPWQRETAGTILAHLAVLVLLLSGGLSFLIQREGYVKLFEGQSTRAMQDYFERELVIAQGERVVLRVPEADLKSGAKLRLPHTSATLTVTDFCSNCASFLQEEPEGKRGLARKLLLQSAPPAKEKEDNKAGVHFTLHDAGKHADGEYVVAEILPSKPAQWNLSPHPHRLRSATSPKGRGDTYSVILTRKTHPLPFSLTLLEFEKLRYPGSDQAREYRSLVEVTQADGSRTQATIAMNEPLRLGGYALYQSSFLEIAGREASVLSVVKNDGWLMPYFGTLLLAIGLGWHLWLRRRKAS